jgi:hypothetical protein
LDGLKELIPESDKSQNQIQYSQFFLVIEILGFLSSCGNLINPNKYKANPKATMIQIAMKSSF